MIDPNRTFVTSDHHFRAWAHFGGALSESTKEEEEQHIALWNSIVGKDSLVLYVGDFCHWDYDRGGLADLAVVPSEGVIGYDFFNNFTLVVDRIGGKMSFVKN